MRDAGHTENRKITWHHTVVRRDRFWPCARRLRIQNQTFPFKPLRKPTDMTFADTLSFFITVFALAIAPGPVVLMMLARAASNDVKGAACFGLGYAIGGLLIITAVCFGLAAWLTSVPGLLNHSKYIMLAYLAWVALGLWRGGSDMMCEGAPAKSSALASTLAGLGTCMISPYMVVMFPLVLPEVMDVTQIKMPDYLYASASTFLALLIASAIVVVFAVQLQRLAQSPRGIRRLNRILALVLITVGGGMVTA